MEAVRALFLKLITAIRLTRLTMAFGAVSDVWFVILLSVAQGSEVLAVGTRRGTWRRRCWRGRWWQSACSHTVHRLTMCWT